MRPVFVLLLMLTFLVALSNAASTIASTIKHSPAVTTADSNKRSLRTVETKGGDDDEEERGVRDFFGRIKFDIDVAIRNWKLERKYAQLAAKQKARIHKRNG
ncbi:hypothetical protein PHYBOEH_009942 [Phytophthora boehmeriae]|uniref:RxLR effector protein n=1 Tax=Phytophthora boehmeriae TaxID=109152 RepID=A0A8T1VPW5_9STRA|nr:hypothetical protein PHYBOEH_009942 [Phytophthora boehmeriae]